ncbi:MAG: SDR family oxidoreductase [Deltaproteobacteria bacterium]|nr:SDR family oxidoreductase [Deltaproteobacteria bacterium]
MKILVTGVSGRIGRIVARRLIFEGHELLGIDRRPWPDAPKGLKMFNADIRKRPAENVFRTEKPDAVIHMATVTHFTSRRAERNRINLGGTRRIFEFSAKYGVKQVVFVGRHTYYGAAADSPLFHTEQEPPMAVSTFPELADLVAADLFAGSALWRYPDMNTCVLRSVYTLGPSRHGTLASFLRGPVVPAIPGFDPLFHFIHEEDAAKAICTALEKRLNGVYNVAGPQPVPLSTLIEVTGRRRWPIPEPFLPRALGRFGLPRLPSGAMAHMKFPVVIDGAQFREATDFEHDYDEVQTMEAFRWA